MEQAELSHHHPTMEEMVKKVPSPCDQDQATLTVLAGLVV